MIELENCIFSDPTAHDIADLRFRDHVSQAIGRNVSIPKGVAEITYGRMKGSICRIEDLGGTKLANQLWSWYGNIVRDTTVVRPDGAPSSARMEPSTNVGTLEPFKLCQLGDELSRWLSAGTHSCKMYVRCSGWTVLPTADELYLEVHYYDTVEAKRASIKSTQAVPSNDVWVELSVTFNLYSDSPCYAYIILKKYEAGAKVYVDIKPIWE